MKKLLAIICTMFLISGAFAYDPVVNERVLKSFKETFTSVEDVKWEEYNTYYTVTFVHSGIRSKVNYDKEGNMLGSIRYYSPQMLPLNIYSKLKREYPTKSLYGVTEVTFGQDVAYYVKIEDAKSWITVKVDASGNSEIYEKYKKG